MMCSVNDWYVGTLLELASALPWDVVPVDGGEEVFGTQASTGSTKRLPKRPSMRSPKRLLIIPHAEYLCRSLASPSSRSHSDCRHSPLIESNTVPSSDPRLALAEALSDARTARQIPCRPICRAKASREALAHVLRHVGGCDSAIEVCVDDMSAEMGVGHDVGNRRQGRSIRRHSGDFCASLFRHVVIEWSSQSRLVTLPSPA